nr:hypothetical protein [Glycomyces salinus]
MATRDMMVSRPPNSLTVALTPSVRQSRSRARRLGSPSGEAIQGSSARSWTETSSRSASRWRAGRTTTSGSATRWW